MILGVFLLVVGIILLSVQFGILSSGIANLVWPMLAIFVGVWLLVGKRHGSNCTCLACHPLGGSKKKGGR